MKGLFLLLIAVIKIILDKGLVLGLVLLSAWLKGKSIKNSTVEWDKYFLSMKESFLNRYFILLYFISTALLYFHCFIFMYSLCAFHCI